MTQHRKRSLPILAAAAALMLGGAAALAAEGETAPVPQQDWTFGGLTGYFDRAQLRRGYEVYKNSCAACHGVRLLHFRNLREPGGPEFNEQRVAEIAAEAQVTDGPNDDGEMFQRPGKPSDRIPPPYANAKAAAAAQNGAVPPDLSVIAKARSYQRQAAWYTEPFLWVTDVATSYQEAGVDYLHALLTGYTDPPEGFQMSDGMHYNKYFPGNQIAMPPPLSDGQIEYADGTPATVQNYAKDVAAFLMWAAEPKLEERKRMGLQVVVYLLILAGLLYLSKRAIWRGVKH
jgi:cytochrome c1